MTLENILSYLPGLQAWMLQIFIIILLALTLNLIVKKVLQRLHKRFKNTNMHWDDAVVEAAYLPAALLIWLLGISFAADIVYDTTQAPIFEGMDAWREIGLIFCLVLFLWKLVRNVERNLIERYERGDDGVADRTTVEAIAKLLRLSLMVTAVLITMQTMGVSISGILAFGGVGGIAVGFAARDLLANFFGGLMIYMDRPFAVGDWVRSPDRAIEGTVEEIGWRLTRIRTFDKRPLYVPNSVFTNVIVENPSRMTHRRIYETIGIRYDDLKVLPSIVDDVKKMLIEHEEIDHTQTLIVNFDNFSESALDFFIYTFTVTTNWIRFHEVKEDVLLKIANIVQAHGAEMAFPTTTVHLPDELKFSDERFKP